VLALALSAAIGLGYAASLWWLLCRETRAALAGVLACAALALTLRVVWPADYPAGLNDDEPKVLQCATQNLRAGRLFVEDCTGLPTLLPSLFQGQLVPLLGPGRWAIRLYSLVSSVLAVAAAYAAARGLGLRVAASLGAAALVAVLPWAIFWGRVSLGGELAFQQFLLLAAVARVLWAAGGWPEVGIGAFALALLLYGYYPARAMLALPVIAVALAPPRQRGRCGTLLAGALAAWVPFLLNRPEHLFGGRMTERLHPDYLTRPLATLWTQTDAVLGAFVAPVAIDGFLTVRAAAMHPALVLVVALAAVAVVEARRVLFLGAGFLIGLVPAVLSDAVSAHRLLMAYPFIVLAAAATLDGLPLERLRPLLFAGVVSIAGVQSVRLYFSDRFWLPDSRRTFDWERTALVDGIPLPYAGRLIAAPQVGYALGPRTLVDPAHEWLQVENWLPANATRTLYAFTQQAAPLRPFYEELVGAERVRTFGRAFSVEFEAGDWTWLRAHGWTYEVQCGTRRRRGQVPALYGLGRGFDDCAPGAEHHMWFGRWLGPPARMHLRHTGTAVVETVGGAVFASEADGVDPTHSARARRLTFSVQPDAVVFVTIRVGGAPFWAALFEVTDAGERIPRWERVAPVGTDRPGGG
jgi:hypothetical protein